MSTLPERKQHRPHPCQGWLEGAHVLSGKQPLPTPQSPLPYFPTGGGVGRAHPLLHSLLLSYLAGGPLLPRRPQKGQTTSTSPFCLVLGPVQAKETASKDRAQLRGRCRPCTRTGPHGTPPHPTPELTHQHPGSWAWAHSEPLANHTNTDLRPAGEGNFEVHPAIGFWAQRAACAGGRDCPT